ncbi:hypothetical protein Tco_0619080, partial [Tanacetum coccineum]
DLIGPWLQQFWATATLKVINDVPHMLAERKYPLSRELMIRMLEHGMEVENETETAICYPKDSQANKNDPEVGED